MSENVSLNLNLNYISNFFFHHNIGILFDESYLMERCGVEGVTPFEMINDFQTNISNLILKKIKQKLTF